MDIEAYNDLCPIVRVPLMLPGPTSRVKEDLTPIGLNAHVARMAELVSEGRRDDANVRKKSSSYSSSTSNEGRHHHQQHVGFVSAPAPVPRRPRATFRKASPARRPPKSRSTRYF